MKKLDYEKITQALKTALQERGGKVPSSEFLWMAYQVLSLFGSTSKPSSHLIPYIREHHATEFKLPERFTTKDNENIIVELKIEEEKEKEEIVTTAIPVEIPEKTIQILMCGLVPVFKEARKNNNSNICIISDKKFKEMKISFEDLNKVAVALGCNSSRVYIGYSGEYNLINYEEFYGALEKRSKEIQKKLKVDRFLKNRSMYLFKTTTPELTELVNDLNNLFDTVRETSGFLTNKNFLPETITDSILDFIKNGNFEFSLSREAPYLAYKTNGVKIGSIEKAFESIQKAISEKETKLKKQNKLSRIKIAVYLNVLRELGIDLDTKTFSIVDENFESTGDIIWDGVTTHTFNKEDIVSNFDALAERRDIVRSLGIHDNKITITGVFKFKNSIEKNYILQE